MTIVVRKKNRYDMSFETVTQTLCNHKPVSTID